MQHCLFLPAARFPKHYFRPLLGAIKPADGEKLFILEVEKAVYSKHTVHRYG
jgi:hypothetical protein